MAKRKKVYRIRHVHEVCKHIQKCASPEELKTMKKFTYRWAGKNDEGCVVHVPALTVGVQSFHFHDSAGTIVEADWLRWMLAKALLNFLALQGKSPPNS